MDQRRLDILQRVQPDRLSGLNLGLRHPHARITFFVRGAVEFGEPGVFMMCEDDAADLTANVHPLGFDPIRAITEAHHPISAQC